MKESFDLKDYQKRLKMLLNKWIPHLFLWAITSTLTSGALVRMPRCKSAALGM